MRRAAVFAGSGITRGKNSGRAGLHGRSHDDGREAAQAGDGSRAAGAARLRADADAVAKHDPSVKVPAAGAARLRADAFGSNGGLAWQ